METFAASRIGGRMRVIPLIRGHYLSLRCVEDWSERTGLEAAKSKAEIEKAKSRNPLELLFP